MKAYEKGLQGEKEACRYLKRRGMKLLDSRVRLGRGEIDLVMRDKDTTVFVEVKYRPQGVEGDGLMAVTPDKRRRMCQAAALYMEANGLWDAPARFDVVEITAQGVYHVPNAFNDE